MHAIVHSAGIQDRDGGVNVLETLFGLYPFLKILGFKFEVQLPVTC